MCMWGIGIWPLIYYITYETPKEYRFHFIFYRKILPRLILSLKLSCLFLRDRHMTLWSHHVTSRMTVRTTDIDLNLGAVLWFQKGLMTLNSVLLMLERNTFGCILFWALGRPIIYVLRYFILCHFVYI